jgi:hypothetical protein
MKDVFCRGDACCRSFYVLLCIGFFATAAHGLGIRAYDAARHDRFSAGYPASPVANTNFYVRFYDFSGVGWNASSPDFSYTLISPMHFVCANHAKPGVGATLNFQGRDGVLRSFTVAGQHNITNSSGQVTDLLVGELDRAVVPCDNITFYPILDLGSDADYLGKQITVYGKTARVGKGTINSFQNLSVLGAVTRVFRFVYTNAAGLPDDCFAEAGDSGSPSFIATNGELFVVSVHTAIATTGMWVDNFDTFVPYYLDQVDAILQQKGYHPATGANEVFRLCYQLTRVGTNARRISWTGHPGRVYRLYGGTNLVNFVPISGLLTANVSAVTYVDSNAVSRAKFYRVRRIDPP